MLNRRIFMSQLCMGGAAMLVSGCGGGAGGGTATIAAIPPTGAAPPPPPPPPPPAPAPAPAVPTLRGITIDKAEQEILAGMAPERDWFAAARTAQSEVVVRSADEFQAAVDAAFDTSANAQALAINHRILCAWNGDSVVAGGPAARITVGRKTLAQTHAAAGGSVTIAAANGYAPAFANSVYVAGQGITFAGIGFTRRAAIGETAHAHALNAVVVQQTATFPVESMVRFDSCKFGALNFDPGVPPTSWVNGVATSGPVARYLAFARCTFRGVQNGAKVVARGCEFESCDFRSALKDGIDLFGHTDASGYYALASISKTTFREWGDTWENRSQHSDAIQTGTAADRHLGYRVVVSDTVAHMTRRFSGEVGKGGGTQGFFNDDHLNADNQFVLRRNIFLVTSPNGFTYFSPQASRPSFVDRCTFMRCGVVPSAFAPDATSQDMTVMVNGSEPAGGPWLMVTDTIAKNGFAVVPPAVSIEEVDPRALGRAPSDQVPEKIFQGRDFGRGNAAANNIAGKFGYALPNESGSQTRFATDVWANFQPLPAFAGKGAPDPRAISWQI